MGVRIYLGDPNWEGDVVLADKLNPSPPSAHSARGTAVWRESKGEWGTEGPRSTGLQHFCGRDNPHTVGQAGSSSGCRTTWRQQSPKAAGAQSHGGHVGEEGTTPTLPEAGATSSAE